MSKNIEQNTGRIIIGLASQPLSEDFLRQPEQSAGDSERETLFWQRVRIRAEEKAREIIARAMEEAEVIKKQAREKGFNEGYAKGYNEGYEKGLEEGRAKGYAEGQAKGYAEGLETGRNEGYKELDILKDDFSTQFSKLINQIEENKSKIWEEYKEELVLLTQVSVEKVLDTILDDNKKQVLQNLFDRAMEQLEDRKELYIKVNPDDKAIMQEIMEKARDKYHQIDRWQLKTDPAIERGGVVLENQNSIIKNTIDVRYAEVKKILDQLDIE